VIHRIEWSQLFLTTASSAVVVKVTVRQRCCYRKQGDRLSDSLNLANAKLLPTTTSGQVPAHQNTEPPLSPFPIVPELR